jgi:serine/threonine protein kinase
MVGVVLAERFELQARIGVGGMASVYACRDLAVHGRLAAVKVLREGDADTRRRFADESLLLANLWHPHLVGVQATGETEDGAPYMVLEYLPGMSLAERLAREGPLPWQEATLLIAQVAGALSVMHRAGVIHRDIKPANIMQIDGAAGRPIAMLIDLGVAKVHDWRRVQAEGPAVAPRRPTDAGKAVGTPGFCPPEATLVPADPRFDVFALGVTLYFLCTGAMPDLGDLRRMTDVRPACGVPPELEALVAAALAILPEDRIDSADELARRLETIRSVHVEDADPFLFDGCYELIELLNAGSQGVVYRAYHRDAGRYVALKLLGERGRGSIEDRLRFAREARVLQAVRHPALPELLDCRTSRKRKQPHIATTLVKGRRASEFCIAGKTLAPAAVIAVGEQVAGALAAMHGCGILHRDVSASNVLIDVGAAVTATLIDPGHAELTDRYYAVVEQRYPTPPESRVKLGTGGLERLEWTAPEARAGAGWTAKSDVYSLGLLLYRLLTGKRPFVGAKTDMIDPRRAAPDCPAALVTALGWALAQDPDERVDAAGLIAQLGEAREELLEADIAAREATVPASHTPAPPTTNTPAPPTTNTPAPTTHTPAPPSSRRYASVVMTVVVIAALVLAWSLGRAMSRETVEVRRLPVAPEAWSPRHELLTVRPDARPAPVLPTMEEALRGAAGPLRGCAALADGLLLVELETTADRVEFASFRVIGDDGPATRGCVGDALASVRFQPAPAGKFIEEYTP